MLQSLHMVHFHFTLRTTSQKSQGPWPCICEGSSLSSKGRTSFLAYMVWHNLCQDYLLEVDLMQIMGDHETLFIVWHVKIHIDFSFMTIYESLGLHLLVWSELFDQWEILDCNDHGAFSIVWEVVLSLKAHELQNWNSVSHGADFGWFSRALRFSWSRLLVHARSGPSTCSSTMVSDSTEVSTGEDVFLSSSNGVVSAETSFNFLISQNPQRRLNCNASLSPQSISLHYHFLSMVFLGISQESVVGGHFQVS